MKQMLSTCILPHFAADFLAQKPYLCTEFQSALKQRKQRKTTQTTQNYARNYESPYLPSAQPKHKGRVQPPPALPNAYHAYLCQDSRRIRHLRRPRTENHTLSVRPPKSPLKPIKGSLKGRYSPDGSGLKIHPPLIIGRTCPTNGKKM